VAKTRQNRPDEKINIVLHEREGDLGAFLIELSRKEENDTRSKNKQEKNVRN